LQIQATLQIIQGDESPILYDLTVTAALGNIWSSDSNGVSKDAFNLGETVYAAGDCFKANELVTVYVVPNGGPYTAPNSLFNTTATANGQGNLGPASLGTYAPGKYDIWVDRNGNGVLDPATEPVDTLGITPGFFVIPEYWLGTVLALAGCFAALGVFRLSKRKHL
jgi:hypothetical protein